MVTTAVTVSFLEQSIAVLRMQRGENRINPEFLRAYNGCLDKLESAPGCKGVVTTGEGKFFSNGIDLDWMGKEENAEKVPTFMEDFQKLLARILIFPLPTVAAISGHCYAGGAVLALAHDLRVMNSQRGWMCLNEIHRNLRFSPFLLSLLRMKMNPGQTLNRALVLGQRFTAEEAVSAGLVDKSMPAVLVEQESRRLLLSWLGKDGYSRESLLNMKRDVYSDVLNTSTKFNSLV
ncbi:hypothetical protein BaRGS_00019779 [Batillaria attramentaria]|uniref:Uncharacterized protein n=1 Tax=Batillaria attramentaria TaxID=370345 RepID=A0ABD0KPK7_9CAEN